MELQLLISTVDEIPIQLLGVMNVQSDAIMVNQCDREEEQLLKKEYGDVNVFCRNERGVGKSRNLAFEKATADLVLFSDEDIRYGEDYAKAICDAFADNPKADILLFNVRVCEARATYYNKRKKRVHGYNCGRYPAYSIAARREALLKSGVKFSELFGGGARFSNGEDSLFLKDCIRAGLKIYTSTVLIGTEIPRESTWFHGYTEKFFYDRGVLFAFLYGKYAKLWALRFVLLKKEAVSGDIKRSQALALIKDGIGEGKRLKADE